MLRRVGKVAGWVGWWYEEVSVDFFFCLFPSCESFLLAFRLLCLCLRAVT